MGCKAVPLKRKKKGKAENESLEKAHRLFSDLRCSCAVWLGQPGVCLEDSSDGVPCWDAQGRCRNLQPGEWMQPPRFPGDAVVDGRSLGSLVKGQELLLLCTGADRTGEEDKSLVGFWKKQEPTIMSSAGWLGFLPTAWDPASGLGSHVCRAGRRPRFGECGAFLPSSAFPLAASSAERCLRGS